MLDILYALSVLILLFFGISLMANGWSLMTKREWKESHEKLPDDMSKEIEGSTHPEMQDIKPGEELIVVRFNKPELDSPELDGEDPLYKSLQERIDTLREENKKDDEEEDDGGDLVSSGR